MSIKTLEKALKTLRNRKNKGELEAFLISPIIRAAIACQQEDCWVNTNNKEKIIQIAKNINETPETDPLYIKLPELETEN